MVRNSKTRCKINSMLPCRIYKQSRVFAGIFGSTTYCLPVHKPVSLASGCPPPPPPPLIYVRMSVHNVYTRVCSFSAACACLLYPSVYSMYMHACMCNCSFSHVCTGMHTHMHPFACTASVVCTCMYLSLYL
jgi:hypothetical protein